MGGDGAGIAGGDRLVMGWIAPPDPVKALDEAEQLGAGQIVPRLKGRVVARSVMRAGFRQRF